MGKAEKNIPLDPTTYATIYQQAMAVTQHTCGMMSLICCPLQYHMGIIFITMYKLARDSSLCSKRWTL